MKILKFKEEINIHFIKKKKTNNVWNFSFPPCYNIDERHVPVYSTSWRNKYEWEVWGNVKWNNRQIGLARLQGNSSHPQEVPDSDVSGGIKTRNV